MGGIFRQAEALGDRGLVVDGSKRIEDNAAWVEKQFELQRLFTDSFTNIENIHPTDL